RSRIVRATDPPLRAIHDFPEDRTELTTRVDPPADRHRRLPILWLVAAVLSAGAAGALMFVGRSGPAAAPGPTPSLQAAAEFIGMKFDNEAQAALHRAEAIASAAKLQSAIMLDAATLVDMVRDRDYEFPIKAHESLEVFQIKGGARTSWLRIPAN